VDIVKNIEESNSKDKKSRNKFIKMTETAETVSAATTAATETPGKPIKPVSEESAAEKPAENGKHENGNGEAAEGENGTNGTTEEASKEEEKKEDPPKEMRSIVLTGFGGFKGVKTLKKPEPIAAAGEVLIRVRACGLNFQDLMVRLGAIDNPPKTPAILGFECAGEVEALGEGVEDFKIGDRVVALPEYRAWAELCAVPTKFVYKLPDELSFQDAAALTMNYLVAYIIVNELLMLRPGKSLMLHSAGGGVGLAIAQLVKKVEGVTLFGVCSKGKHEELAAGGLFDHLIDRTDYVNEIRKITPEGVDIILDCLCGDDCNRGYGLLKPMGKYILFGSSNVVTGETKSFFSVARSWWQVDKVSPIKLFDENKTLTGFNLRHLLYQQDGSEYVRGVVNDIFSLFKDGKIKPVIDSTWALEDVTEAMQKMHDRKNIGKIILDPSAEPKPKPATPAKAKKEKKEKKEKVQSPSSEEDKKVENGEDKPEANGSAENGVEAATSTENAETEKPKENGAGEAKPAENVENGETAPTANGEDKKTSS
jgi:NADPH:quinone reductase-like Zn-dependent oxidoreductase